ncbi:MAG: oxidoreductase [Acidimicrobiia bacterium]
MSEWTADDIPDCTDLTFVVTGANSGLGLETARQLARHRASVILACRNTDKGLAALDVLRSVDPGAHAEVRELDLADLGSVRRFADDLRRDRDSVDVLVNNAGVMAIPRLETADGFEMQFGTNHLGHFALTGRLLPMLRRGNRPRVVTVSSGAHRVGTMNFDDLHGEARYRRWGAYGQSKLANLLFTYELARRIDAAGVDLVAVATHPGYAATNLQGVGPTMSGRRVSELLASASNTLFAQSVDRGAIPTLYAATAGDVVNGDYFGPDGLGEQRGRHPRRVGSSRRSRDVADAQRLWDLSEELTGVSFDLAP